MYNGNDLEYSRNDLTPACKFALCPAYEIFDNKRVII